MIKFIPVLFLLSILSGSLLGGELEARKVRQLLQVKPTFPTAMSFIERSLDTDVILRTTEGMSQGSSQFCWVFAALNMLESNFLTAYPEVQPNQVELSRWYFTESTGSRNQRGTSIDALYYEGYSPMFGFVALDDYSSGVPNSTQFLDKTFSPTELRDFVLNEKTFWSYAFNDSTSGWSQHPDPDAKPNTQSYYVNPSNKLWILDEALKKGYAAEISVSGHSIIVYGATYNSSGTAIKYKIKDSYPDYFYDADPASLAVNVWEITTIGNLF